MKCLLLGLGLVLALVTPAFAQGPGRDGRRPRVDDGQLPGRHRQRDARGKLGGAGRRFHWRRSSGRQRVAPPT